MIKKLKVYKEGTPTKGSERQNGNQKNWIDITIKNSKAEINSKLAFIIGDSVNVSLNNLTNNINSVR